MGAFDGERATVIGLGVAGASAARVLAAEGATVSVSESERATGRPAEELRSEGIRVMDGGHLPEHLDGATLVVASPGVRPDAAVLLWARERRLPIWGEMELGARLVTCPYVAVTGTNGKTTTTAMVAACFRAAGLDAVACGNIGRPFPQTARERHDALVVEVSSFQLAMQESFHPKVSVLLNLAPDHLDWHGSFASYASAKARVFSRQGDGDVHVGNRDDPAAADVSGSAPCDVRWFTSGPPSVGDAGVEGGRVVADWSGADLGMPSDATPAIRSDAAACAAVAHAFGIDDEAIRRGIDAFVPEPHRGQTVAVAAAVTFVDDSKATNPHAVLASLGDRDGVVLIAGGDAKGVDLSPLRSLVPKLVGVVAIGSSAAAVRAVFEDLVGVRDAVSIEQATRMAFEMASPGDTVLLAPACASWDMFRDYVERGERFTTAALALEKQEART